VYFIFFTTLKAENQLKFQQHSTCTQPSSCFVGICQISS